MATSYTPTTFAVAVLQKVGMPVTRANVQALVGFAKAEGGHWNNDARYNPYNTTMPAPGAGNTGRQGNIKVYTSWAQGIDATARTLKNGKYGNILAALRKGNNAVAVGHAIDNSPWCPGCGAYTAGVIAQTKVGKIPAVTTPAVMGPLATPRPQITLASQAKATPPSVNTTLVPRTVEPDTSFQGAIQQLAQAQQPQAPAVSGGFDPGYSTVLSGRPAPVPQSTGFVGAPAQGVGSQIAGLSQLVGPSTFLDTKTTVTPGKVTPGKTTPIDGRNTGMTTPSLLPEHHSGLLELIHKSASGPGYAVKKGKIVDGKTFYSDVWNGHADHVHVAAGPNTIVDVGKMAQAMGLHVAENPHFGGVTQGAHTATSYHYRGEAIDVTGTPKQMDAFAREVEQAFGLIGGAASTARTGPPSALATTVKAKPGLPVADYTGLVQGTHPTGNLPGFPAKDYGAPAGSAVVAPVAGTVYKLSGNDPKLGPQGPGKALGWTVYIRGTDGREYFITHLGSRSAHVGEAVKQGTKIGTVADFEKYGTPNHIHMGVHG